MKYNKQETLEEVAKNESEYLADWEDKDMYKKGFVEGAKWQQERSYSEEEVKVMYRSLWVGNCFDFDTSYEMETNFEHDFNLWFEQFKKK
jgi:hypothetical protein